MAHYLNTFNSLREFDNYLQGASLSPLFVNNNRKPSSLTEGNAKWYGTDSFDEANELMRKGDKKNASKLNATCKINAPSLGLGMQKKGRNEIVGFIPNVGAYLSGSPLNMINFRNIPAKKKVITIIYCLSVGSNVKAKEMLEASCNLINAILGIEATGKRVNLFLISGSANSYSYSKEGESCLSLLKIKDSGSLFDKSKMAYPLINPAFFRRHIFKAIESEKGLTDSCFTETYGKVPDKPFFEKVLKEKRFEYDAAITFYDIYKRSPESIKDLFLKKQESK